MKTIAALLTALALTGCANLSPVENVLLGAAVGGIIVQESNRQQPVYVAPVYNQVYIRRQVCYQIPIYDYYNRIVGFRPNCHWQ
jgi:uncharacterized membrane protein